MRLAGILLITSVVGCRTLASSGGTQVGRERLLVTGDGRLDPYFLAVYGHQKALADIDARRAALSAALCRPLDLPENADRVTLSAALRAALDRARIRRVRVRVTAAPDLDERVEAWQRALSSQAPEDPARAIAARYTRVVEAVVVTVTPVAATEDPAESDTTPVSDTGALPATEAALGAVLEAIAAMMRDAEATRRCMARLRGRTPTVFARGAELRAQASPQWWPEFEAAERFVLGLHARATLHEQEAIRTQRWVLGALRPESEADSTDPDEEHESS